MFDAVTANHAANKVMRKLGESGAIGRIEPGKVLTFDGDTTDKQNLDGVFYKISDTSVDLNAVTKVVVSVHPDVASATGMPETMEFGKDRLTVEKNDNGDVLSGDNMPLVVSYDGVYVIVESGEAAGLEGVKVGTWVSRIEFTETIHTIDPKFLPEGVGDNSVTIDLTELGMDFTSFFSGERFWLSTEMIALANHAYENECDIVVVMADDSSSVKVKGKVRLSYNVTTVYNGDTTVVYTGLMAQGLDDIWISTLQIGFMADGRVVMAGKQAPLASS